MRTEFPVSEGTVNVIGVPRKLLCGRTSAGFSCRLILGVVVILPHALLASDSPPADAALPNVAKAVRFESDVIPILRAYCWKCHGGEGLEADLDLRTFPLLLRGGKHGPVIERGSSERSRLFQRVYRQEMPPGDGLKPTAEHLAILRDWLNAGAPADDPAETIPPHVLSASDREWWAFRKPVRAPTPQFDSTARVANPIDAYLLRRLSDRQLTFSPPADRASWIRRVSLDLLGLPPRPEDVDQYLGDESPDADERLVDRLLASPHYGERWGRHWLDAAGYVDTIGSDNDAGIIEERERIWMYRDYVLRSLNADKPFDRFLLEQLAGDELSDWKTRPQYDDETLELLTATGFLRQAADVTYAPELNTSDIRHQVLFDTVQILSSNLLGLTVHCAQCHDHKFDPISQAEYFQLAAFLAPAYDPQHWKHSKERFLFDVSLIEQAIIDGRNKEIDGEITQRTQLIAQAKAPFAQRLAEQKLAALPEPLRADTQAAVQTPGDQRTPVQKYLAEKLGPLIAVADAEINQALDEPARAATAKWNDEIRQLAAGKRTYGKVQALWNLGTPKSYLYHRGDFQKPGPEVRPVVPAVLTDPAKPFAPPAEITGRRTALAQWLTQPDHPLTARVFVNRVWQNLFGRGLVATPDNFGASGSLPSHPELLDWLAREFVDQGWSVKRIQRQMLATAAYRQSSRLEGSPGPAESVDPENVLLWRMPLRRLDSEIVRDSLLAVSGALDPTLYGPPLPLKSLADGRVEIDVAKVPPNASPHRRSLYLFCRRNYQLTEMSVFDQPVVAHNCTRRVSTAVVLQSLTLLNGSFALDQAGRFAATVRAAQPVEARAGIERAYQWAFNRRPDADEVLAAEAFLKDQTDRLSPQLPPDQAAAAAWDGFCQMLLNASEFLYVP